ncbi:hypothetical protein KC946_03990 [Candidatus Saccharibacteria bacterium]|nr:hypothetical protein [Candidatus Saccharibacteria bacterium]
MEKQGKNKNQHLLRGVKKTGGLLNSGFSIVKSSKLTTYILVLIVGIGLGYGGGRLLPSSSESDVKTKSSSLAAKPRAELTEKEKLQLQYERVDKDVIKSKEKVDDDLVDKDITDAQSEMINNKIDEVAIIRKTLDNTKDEDRKKLKELKLELRKWSTENDVRNSYVSRVL